MTYSQQTSVKDHYRDLASEYESRANRTCEQTFLRLVRRFFMDRRCLLELGSGSNDVLNHLGCPRAVACDLSLDMLRMRDHKAQIHCVVAAGEALPFRSAQFDGLFLINVLEHVASVEAVLEECARVLQDDGIWLAVTPNGNWETLLDLAERWSLKIPEGPHSFLTTQRLRLSVQKQFEVLEHGTFLVLPVGPPRLAGLVDKVTFCSAFGWGFFQYLVAKKRRSRP